MKIEDIDSEFRALADSLKSGDEAFQQGNLQLAESIFEGTLSTIEDFGDEHPDAESCVSKLADVYYARRKFAEAADMLLRVYQIRGRRVGCDHPAVVPVLFKTAKCYERQGMALEAKYVYLQCLGLLSKAGLADRALAASVLESYAHMLHGIEGKEEEADELDERARDLRDPTREKLSAELIKRIAEIGYDVEELLATPNASIQRLQTLRSRASEMDLEPPKPARTKQIILCIMALTLVVGSLAGFFVYRQSLDTEKKRKAKAAAAVPAVFKPRSETYKTIDGLEQLILFDNNDATFVSAGASKKGTFAMAGGSLQMKTKSEKLSFQKGPDGFADENGVVMYNPTAKEMEVAATMRKIALQAQNSYHAGGSYVSSVPTYQNAFTGTVEAPAINKIGKMDRSVNFDTLDKNQDQINQVLTWSRYSTGRNGFIELYHYASADEGDTLYIKGTDGHGTYLRSTQPQNAYVVRLVNGELK